VKCAVTNSGSSIPAEDMPRVFDRFFRGDRARRTSAGSGLGLAITRQLVELNDGSIEATNAPSGGVTFTLSMPG
jgi:signal transduction histidine kinase